MMFRRNKIKCWIRLEQSNLLYKTVDLSSLVIQNSVAVLQNSWQNNYVRIGPASEAVLSAIIFVSMIADRPMEIAIIISDPQKQAVGVSRSSTWAQPCTEACSASPCNEVARFKPFWSRCSIARAQASAHANCAAPSPTERCPCRRGPATSGTHKAPQARSEQMLVRDCKK
jgi:hypothetical protein